SVVEVKVSRDDAADDAVLGERPGQAEVDGRAAALAAGRRVGDGERDREREDLRFRSRRDGQVVGRRDVRGIDRAAYVRRDVVDRDRRPDPDGVVAGPNEGHATAV